jgi:hypothetical protein
MISFRATGSNESARELVLDAMVMAVWGFYPVLADR